jgi:hypothetical protein
MKKNRVSVSVSFIAIAIALAAVVTCVVCNAGNVPVGKLPVRPWAVIGKANLSNAVETRVGIILKSLEGKIMPSPDLPQDIWKSPYKTAAYYCGNLSEEGYVPDGLEAIIDRRSVNERWPDQVPWVMGADESAMRSAVIALLRAPAVFRIVADGVVKATVGTTSDKTAKNRKKIMEMLDTAHAYLDTFDMKAEDAWLAECKHATAKAVEADNADKKTFGERSFFAVQYRFNQYGPGKYKEGAAPSADRYIQTFIFRRLKDGMTEKEIRADIWTLRRSLRPRNVEL